MFEGWDETFEGFDRPFEGCNETFEGFGKLFEDRASTFASCGELFEGFNKPFEGYISTFAGYEKPFKGFYKTFELYAELFEGNWVPLAQMCLKIGSNVLKQDKMPAFASMDGNVVPCQKQGSPQDARAGGIDGVGKANQARNFVSVPTEFMQANHHSEVLKSIKQPNVTNPTINSV